MKKLLSLLSVLTISTGVIRTVIATGYYQKQEKLNNNNNYLQTNNLENLNYKKQKQSNNENNKINKTKIVITTNGRISANGITLNNKLYFGSGDHNVYEYDPNYYNLGQINDNSDSVILSELNYLIYDLDVSQLKIINKTNNSAIVKEKNNLNNNININVQYSINNRQNKIINLNELIKKALFFRLRDENPNLKFKKVSDINNNLIFLNIKVTRGSKLLHSIDFKNICFNKKHLLIFP